MRRLLARLFLWITGWRQVGDPPALDKYIAVSAPHTSNWDFFYLLAFAWLHRIKFSWMGKKSLFRGLLGWMARKLGGIPIDRSSRHNVVEQVAKAFREAKRMVLAIPPEGTRSRTEHWKSGFYHIARAAGVPLALGALDYKRKQIVAGPVFHPGDDVGTDMDRVRAFYADKAGRYPEKFGPVRLKEEPGAGDHEEEHEHEDEHEHEHEHEREGSA